MTRHRVDTSVQFNRRAKLPATRKIEVADVDPVPSEEPEVRKQLREPYFASAELEDAVNLAIALGRPLLLQGDPGAGKTRLAHAVAYALGLPLEEAYIKSTSNARDLLYVYDAVTRIYEAQLGERGPRHVGDAKRYVRLGPLGRAIVRAGYGRRSVVLIDEIDKADIDFPNDLLREIDQLSFEVPEAAGMNYSVPDDALDLRPIIFVTNNEEKTLSAAFLRRCIFHYVEFPSTPADLNRILALHGIADGELSAKAVAALLSLREVDLVKKPGLSELLDWVGYLEKVGTPPETLAALPHVGALLKQRADQTRMAGGLADR